LRTFRTEDLCHSAQSYDDEGRGRPDVTTADIYILELPKKHSVDVPPMIQKKTYLLGEHATIALEQYSTSRIW